MNTYTTVNIISWSLIAVQLILLIFSMYATVKSGKRILKWSKEKYETFTKQQLEVIQQHKEAQTRRIDLLSKENARLIQENEKLREKLWRAKNLGFPDN